MLQPGKLVPACSFNDSPIGQYDTDVFKVRNRDIEQILQLPGYAEELYDQFGLFAEMPVNSERFLGVNVRHLKVVL
jgi:hypothetical protein